MPGFDKPSLRHHKLRIKAHEVAGSDSQLFHILCRAHNLVQTDLHIFLRPLQLPASVPHVYGRLRGLDGSRKLSAVSGEDFAVASLNRLHHHASHLGEGKRAAGPHGAHHSPQSIHMAGKSHNRFCLSGNCDNQAALAVVLRLKAKALRLPADDLHDLSGAAGRAWGVHNLFQCV